MIWKSFVFGSINKSIKVVRLDQFFAVTIEFGDAGDKFTFA